MGTLLRCYSARMLCSSSSSQRVGGSGTWVRPGRDAGWAADSLLESTPYTRYDILHSAVFIAGMLQPGDSAMRCPAGGLVGDAGWDSLRVRRRSAPCRRVGQVLLAAAVYAEAGGLDWGRMLTRDAYLRRDERVAGHRHGACLVY